MCSAEGMPSPQFDKWSRGDEKLLEKDPRFKQLSNGRMYVDPVQPDDKGKYTCTMKQNRGAERSASKSQSIDVSVVGE